MKKSKKILWCSYLLLCFLTFYRLNASPLERELSFPFIGRIVEVKTKENSIVYIVQGKERIVAYSYTQKEKIPLGTIVKIEGKEIKLEKNRNFYLFNYKNYLKSKGITRQVTVQNLEIEKQQISFAYKIKNAFLNYLQNFEKTKEYMLLLLYGENTLDEEIYKGYQNIGIVHLFAISGMHIGFFVHLFEKLIKKGRQRDVLLFFFLTFYLFLVKSSPGITRAILCENIFIVAKKRWSREEILVFVFFLMLLVHPYILYHTGFQLSFLLSFTLGFIRKKKTKKVLISSFFLFLVSLPIVVNMNFEVNLFTPFYNLIFVPFVSYLLFPTLLITFFLPYFEVLLLLEITILEKGTAFLNAIPSTLPLGYFSLLSLLFFYSILLFSFWRKKYLLLLFVFLLFHYFKHDLIVQNKITLFDVGQGDSILIEKGVNILIDTGGEKEKTKALSILIPSLKARGIHKLDALILTHGDFDHAGSAMELLANFKVDKVYLNGSSDTKLEQEILTYLEENHIDYKKVVEQSWMDQQLGLTLLHFENAKNENEDSLLTYMKIKNYNILLMGDAGNPTEEKLLQTYKIPEIDILKVGHHGSKYSSSLPFLKEIHPQYALISVGKTNTYGHPSPKTIDRLTTLNTTILDTSTKGSIELHLDRSLWIRTCLQSATR